MNNDLSEIKRAKKIIKEYKKDKKNCFVLETRYKNINK